MVDTEYETLPINIEDELKQSYLDYAMSVIVGRALPDVRDGLKPVHRRVLFAMNVLGNDWNKAYKKSARVVGDVIGKYHPHGDTAVYDTIVRMAQDFSMRYLLVDGQGNFGSIDGDNPAAMRYTEVRMTKLSHQLLADLEKETVDFVPNYDGNEMMPSVLPTRVPNLLVNGASGIAVGMATNIPPHNLTEVVNACLLMLDQPDVDLAQIMEVVTGPDFPTGAIINGRAGILEAYRTGRGRIYVRAKAEVEYDEKSKRDVIIVHEIPYQVNKARLIEKIAELVKDKKIEGISEIRDESDKDGLRIVIELKRGESGEVLLNNLYSQTQMETVFGINMVALEDGQPKLFNLRDIIRAFIRHRRTVVTRRTWYELKKARERGHVLEGLVVALANIDPVIQAIKTSPTPQIAKERLLGQGWEPGDVIAMLERAGDDAMCRPDDLEAECGVRDGLYHFSPIQVQQILDMRLNRLTGLERDKLIEEYTQKLEEIADLMDILANDSRLVTVIREELEAVRDEFGDERRTVIESSRRDLDEADLIPEETVVVTISNSGYAKTQPLSVYQAQRRGGRGKSATAVKDEDFISHLLVCSSHDTILCFTDQGKVHWVKAFHIPQASRGSRGRPIVNMLNLAEDEVVTAILPLEDVSKSTMSDGRYIFMATRNGTIKKVELSAFARPRNGGLIALDLEGDDHLVGVNITHGEDEIILVSSSGKAIRFNEQDVRAMGRTARGVRGMKLDDGASIIASMVVVEGLTLLTTSEQGYGKRTALTEFSTQGRGGRGVIAMQCSERNGALVGAAQVSDEHEVLLISDQGTMVRTECSGISVMGRNTQGVTLIRVQEGERLTGVVSFDEPDEDLETDGADDGTNDGSDAAEPTDGADVEGSGE